MIRIQIDRDKQHLQLLVMFHYILAGLAFVTGCSPSFHLGFGIAILVGAFDQDPNPPPQGMGWLLTCVGSSVMLLCWAMTILLVLAARWLNRRAHWHLCFAIACLECIYVFQGGTILGVFTLIVLSRPRVKAMFQDEQPSQPPPLAAADGAP